MAKPVLTASDRDRVQHGFAVLGRHVKELNEHSGWHDVEATKGDRIALIHSEASELLEWTRQPGPVQSGHIDALGETEELADIVIRAVDYANVYGLHLGPAVLAKLDYNATRGYRHGGKKT